MVWKFLNIVILSIIVSSKSGTSIGYTSGIISREYVRYAIFTIILQYDGWEFPSVSLRRILFRNIYTFSPWEKYSKRVYYDIIETYGALCALWHYILYQSIVLLIHVNACRYPIPSFHVVALDRPDGQKSAAVKLACQQQPQVDLLFHRQFQMSLRRASSLWSSALLPVHFVVVSSPSPSPSPSPGAHAIVRACNSFRVRARRPRYDEQGARAEVKTNCWQSLSSCTCTCTPCFVSVSSHPCPSTI